MSQRINGSSKCLEWEKLGLYFLAMCSAKHPDNFQKCSPKPRKVREKKIEKSEGGQEKRNEELLGVRGNRRDS